ncbi:MAG: hypothetical protein HXX09_05305 [Bacteroidetes bacterium]|nr:hypothetical protein [Bacteroidota bacterium]
MKKFQKINFIYITSLEYCNVFVSQIIDWLHLYQEKEVSFELWRLSSLKKLIFNRKAETLETQLIRKLYQGRVKKLFIIKPKISLGLIFNTLLFSIFLSRKLLSQKKLLIQTRSPDLWKPLKFFKLIFPNKLKIIYDSRAAIAEELIYSNPNQFNILKEEIKRISQDEIEMIKISDKTFCVSNILIEYHLQKDSNIDRSRFFLYPCSSNSDVFFYSKEKRREYRERYRLTEKIVFVYSGGLKSPWHIPEKIFELFAGLFDLDNNSFLIILSPDKDIAEQYITNLQIPRNSILVSSVTNVEVSGFLCASDVAFLLRDDVKMNNVASPTKFAEYILTGLPVIISKNVGDFSSFVKDNDLGLVINNEFSEENIIEIHSYFNKKAESFLNRRTEIAELGLSKYSKNLNTDSIIEQYLSIIS